MKYYSTNNVSQPVSLEEAVIHGLASDGGLLMPEKIGRLPQSFFDHIACKSWSEIACTVADLFFGEDIPAEVLHPLTEEALCFPIPLVHVAGSIFSLELFYGPTLAFKDVGARFMARLLGYFNRQHNRRQVNVLVATSGDTGSAVANGFLGVDGVRVFVLYPKGKVSSIQEKQFTTLGQNITALEVEGTFDDCQALVKRSFRDEELTRRFFLSSANSINVARFLPQAFYYFYAYAQLRQYDCAERVVCAVPSGNLGNLTAGLFAKRAGLPIRRFVAANNRNDVLYRYLQTGQYAPRPSLQTIANAMDVGDPSNFARMQALYGGRIEALRADVSGKTYDDEQICDTLRTVYRDYHYLLDPHGACACRALEEGLGEGETGFFVETAHPAKFQSTVAPLIGDRIPLPDRLQSFMSGRKETVPMSSSFPDFKSYLMKELSKIS